jgi:hypothetical protein
MSNNTPQDGQMKLYALYLKDLQTIGTRQGMCENITSH